MPADRWNSHEACAHRHREQLNFNFVQWRWLISNKTWQVTWYTSNFALFLLFVLLAVLNYCIYTAIHTYLHTFARICSPHANSCCHLPLIETLASGVDVIIGNGNHCWWLPVAIPFAGNKIINIKIWLPLRLITNRLWRNCFFKATYWSVITLRSPT